MKGEILSRWLDVAYPKKRMRLSPFGQEKQLPGLLGDRLLRYAHQRLLGTALDPLSIEEGPWGKPSFSDDRFFFNLSHSENYVFLAASNRPVGVDVERMRPRGLEIIQRVLAPEEYEVYQCASRASDRERLFYRFWTLKESYVKYMGAGIRRTLPQIVFHLTQPIDMALGGNYLLYEEIPGYQAALCHELFQATWIALSLPDLLEVSS